MLEDVYRVEGFDYTDPDAQGRRFFKLTLVTGQVCNVAADHYRLTEQGLLALAYWMGPDENPEDQFQVHAVYPPGAWLSFVEDEEARRRWHEKCEEQAAEARAEHQAYMERWNAQRESQAAREAGQLQ